MPPADVRLGRLIGVGLRLTLLQFEIVKARLQPLERDVLVLVLRTLLLREDDDARWLMHEADSRIPSG